MSRTCHKILNQMYSACSGMTQVTTAKSRNLATYRNLKKSKNLNVAVTELEDQMAPTSPKLSRRLLTVGKLYPIRSRRSIHRKVTIKKSKKNVTAGKQLGRNKVPACTFIFSPPREEIAKRRSATGQLTQKRSYTKPSYVNQQLHNSKFKVPQRIYEQLMRAQNLKFHNVQQFRGATPCTVSNVWKSDMFYEKVAIESKNLGQDTQIPSRRISSSSILKKKSKFNNKNPSYGELLKSGLLHKLDSIYTQPE